MKCPITICKTIKMNNLGIPSSTLSNILIQMKTKLFSSFVLIIAISCLPFTVSAVENPIKPFVIVLDAGHGGHDHGNKGNGYKESEISLNIVLKIGAELEKLPNVKVI